MLCFWSEDKRILFMTTTTASSKDKNKQVIKISLAHQIVEAFEGMTRVFRFECVTGDKDHPTDRGVFKIIRKPPDYRYRSRAYNVQMNYPLFFTSDGKALHQYHGYVPLSVVRTARSAVSEWFGSHGCVRLAQADAKALYEWASIGTAVQVQ
jgi:lipoprotein-anchoring transpeptidase ErfK/SrfK